MIFKKKVLGELVSSELEQLGFTIIKDYSDLNKGCYHHSRILRPTKIFMACVQYIEEFAALNIFY